MNEQLTFQAALVADQLATSQAPATLLPKLPPPPTPLIPVPSMAIPCFMTGYSIRKKITITSIS
ncbi:hypothetical protein [Paraflavitalea speifideaquila]|uniref:hypothetical protein n=1 Tax=Paraflavitalea speifideaquila TaxID=3076558 RepID=UPI0028EB50B9|nr:hypothetical protein [Paraflavitalea speifideiaquila]